MRRCRWADRTTRYRLERQVTAVHCGHSWYSLPGSSNEVCQSRRHASVRLKHTRSCCAVQRDPGRSPEYGRSALSGGVLLIIRKDGSGDGQHGPGRNGGRGSNGRQTFDRGDAVLLAVWMKVDVGRCCAGGTVSVSRLWLLGCSGSLVVQLLQHETQG